MKKLINEMSLEDMKEVNGGGFIDIITFQDHHLYLFGLKII